MRINSKAMRLVCLVFFIMLFTLPIHSLANDEKTDFDTTISIGNVTGSAGEVIDVPVKISQPTKDIAAYGLEINYDQDVLKVVGIKAGYGKTNSTCSDEAEGCFWSNFDNTKGFMRTAWADPTAGDHSIKEGLTLFTVQVEILKPDYVGDQQLTIQTDNQEAVSFTDPSNQSLAAGVDASTGNLTIVKATDNDGGKSVKEASKNEASKNESLPKTATAQYNWLLAGGLFLLVGVIILFVRLRKTT